MRLVALAAAVLIAMGGAALAQEQEDVAVSFARIKGGAVFDYRMGVDGAAVTQQYMLTHVVCSDDSKALRVMLPVSLADDGTVYEMGGPKSTLRKVGGTYQAVFLADGKRIRKTMELKPVNDPRSKNQRQFEVRVDYDSPLWTALTSGKPRSAVLLIGQGGLPVAVPTDPKLDAALKSCGIKR